MCKGVKLAVYMVAMHLKERVINLTNKPLGCELRKLTVIVLFSLKEVRHFTWDGQ